MAEMAPSNQRRRGRAHALDVVIYAGGPILLLGLLAIFDKGLAIVLSGIALVVVLAILWLTK